MKTISSIRKNNEEYEKQLRQPTGENGKVVGRFLTKYNLDKSLWSLSYLDINPDDIVLEIGFGTGHTIKRISHLLTSGKIYGLDFSKIMVQETNKVNRAGIKAGKIIINYGDIKQSPYKDNTFDKILAVNVLYFWDQPVNVLKEILRILKPKGKLALYIYHKDMQKNRANSNIFHIYSGEEVKKLLESIGFKKVITHEKLFENNKMLGVCITGHK